MSLFSFLKSNNEVSNPQTIETKEVESYLNQRVRHYLPSYLLSLDDEPFQPSQRLIEIGLEASKKAFSNKLKFWTPFV